MSRSLPSNDSALSAAEQLSRPNDTTQAKSDVHGR